MSALSLRAAIAEGYRYFDFSAVTSRIRRRGTQPPGRWWNGVLPAVGPAARVRHAAWRTGEAVRRWAAQVAGRSPPRAAAPPLGSVATAGRIHFALDWLPWAARASASGSARVPSCRWPGSWPQEGAHDDSRHLAAAASPPQPRKDDPEHCAPAASARTIMRRSPTASGKSARRAAAGTFAGHGAVLPPHRRHARRIPGRPRRDVFERQIAWLKRNFDLVSLEEAQTPHRLGT